MGCSVPGGGNRCRIGRLGLTVHRSAAHGKLERRIIALRFVRRWGPHRIGYQPRCPAVRRSVGCLVGIRCLCCTTLTWPPDCRFASRNRSATRLPSRASWSTSISRNSSGSGRRRMACSRARLDPGPACRLRPGQGSAGGAPSSRGFSFLHHAVDDHSRLAYSEQLPDERKETASAFWVRACAFFASHGITVTAVMTDNGSCYRSRAFAAALGPGIKHRRTRPYRPQTNGKVERFNRTLATEWAYASPTRQKLPAQRATNTGSITTITTDPHTGNRRPSPLSPRPTTSWGTTPRGRGHEPSALRSEVNCSARSTLGRCAESGKRRPSPAAARQ